MPKPSRAYRELEEAFRNRDHPGWWIDSAEGGWTTPSEADWGRYPSTPASPKGTPAAPRSKK